MHYAGQYERQHMYVSVCHSMLGLQYFDVLYFNL